MSMNKKLCILFTIIISIIIFVKTKEVNAVSNCSVLDENACKITRDCEWTGGACFDIYVAADPCGDDNIKKALNFLGYLLMIAKVAVPLIIVIVGTFDIFKSVVDKDEKSLSKQVKLLLMRVVAGVFIFFLPTLVYALFGISSDLDIVNDSTYEGCVTCLLKPTDCKIDTIDGVADENGECSSGYTKGVDGICYKNNVCGAYTTKDTCPSSCKWSARNGCQSK